ncbi:unnamed protein product [Mycena citricolor]|uniref:Gag-like protein n=1 Tax=Mycena citricolor TaxID=2018698 RepID=A0AAD2H2V3_9AGAR|nr:unnamed protein product [Mycena citricolor]
MGTRSTPAREMYLRTDLTRAQLYKTDSGIDLNKITAQEATRTLVAKGFLAETVSDLPSSSDLALAILRAAGTSGLSVIVADALRTIAHLVETLNSPNHSKQIGDDVREVLNILWGKTQDANKTGPGQPTTAAAKLSNTVEQQCKILELATERLETRMEEASSRAANAAAHSLESTRTHPATYAEAAREAPPPQLATAFAQTKARKLQITIRAERDTTPTWNELNDRETLAKVNLALEAAWEAALDDDTRPEEVTARASQRTKNGALIIHMTTQEGAEWIQEKDNMPAFLNALGGSTIHTPRNFTIIADFVPVSFDPDSPAAIGELEDSNGMGSGHITNARYIKLKERRTQGQRVAHMMIGFKSAETANRALKYGLFIECTKVNCRKILQEPTRCVKCQFYNTGHVAKTCKSIHDTCARCGEMHRTSTCAATDEQLACSNCRAHNLPANGHGAADRNCPVFAKLLQENRQRNPDAQYRYYPVNNDPTSWETTQMQALDVKQQERTFQGGNRPIWRPPPANPPPSVRPASSPPPPPTTGQAPSTLLTRDTLQQTRTFGDQARPGAQLRQTTLPFQSARRNKNTRTTSPPTRSWDDQVNEQGTGEPIFPRVTPPNER